jgi:hypothetical protein
MASRGITVSGSPPVIKPKSVTSDTGNDTRQKRKVSNQIRGTKGP